MSQTRMISQSFSSRLFSSRQTWTLEQICLEWKETWTRSWRLVRDCWQKLDRSVRITQMWRRELHFKEKQCLTKVFCLIHLIQIVKIIQHRSRWGQPEISVSPLVNNLSCTFWYEFCWYKIIILMKGSWAREWELR